MRVELSAPSLTVAAGRSAVVRVKVTNTGTIISGYHLRVLGLDPAWARSDAEDLSLFPGASGELVVTVQLPEGLPAGTRTLDVVVREVTPPFEVAHRPLELTVPASPKVTVSLDPQSVTGASAVSVGILVENTGNAEMEVPLAGKDGEGLVSFEITPAAPRLAPGERVIAAAKLRAKRPLAGNPKVRPFTVTAGSGDPPATAAGVFVQRPRLTRGNLAFLGLLAAATVFAVVISATLSQVVNQTNANRDLALQVVAAAESQPTTGAASISGLVVSASTQAPVSGVTVALYAAANPSQPVVTAATRASGTFGFTHLAAGTYKMSFTGAGFSQLWYPDSSSAKGAGVITLGGRQRLQGVDVRIGGVPAQVSGQVLATSPQGAVVTLELPPASGGSPGSSPASSPASSPTSAGTASASPPAVVVASQTVSASGSFDFTGVPSPGIYDLAVSEAGYAPATQEIDLSGGESRSGVTIQLHKGNGSISGTVASAGKPLGDATVSATSGTTTLSTVTATTKGKVGTFLLASLPTPASFTLTVTAPGYASQTLSVTLAAAQQVTGIAVDLLPGLGSISGTVGTPAGLPVGGVTVTATNGTTSVTTDTLSIGHPGAYRLSGLPVPGTYTVTFSRADLASQTQQVSLPATGDVHLSGVDVSMVAETATISGVVTEKGGNGVPEVAVGLSSGTTSYTTTSATRPTPGAFEIDGVAPGTYNLTFTRPGGVPTSVIVALTAGQDLVEHEVLTPAASIYGYVLLSGTRQPVPGAQVNLYLSDQYPTVIDETTTTNTQGEFTFANVAAPQGYIVAVSYPVGTAPQATVLVTTRLGAASPVCGTTPTTSTTTTAPTTTTTAPATTTTAAPTTTTTTTTTAGSSTCDPQASPILVSVS